MCFTFFNSCDTFAALINREKLKEIPFRRQKSDSKRCLVYESEVVFINAVDTLYEEHRKTLKKEMTFV